MTVVVRDKPPEVRFDVKWPGRISLHYAFPEDPDDRVANYPGYRHLYADGIQLPPEGPWSLPPMPLRFPVSKGAGRSIHYVMVWDQSGRWVRFQLVPALEIDAAGIIPNISHLGGDPKGPRA